MEIQGKTAKAVIFTENIEDAALMWLKDLCNHPAMEGMKVWQMPDVHAGMNCNVGTAYEIGNYINPDHVGADIGCTVSLHRLSARVKSEDFALLDHRIREAIPMGNNLCGRNTLNEKELFKFINSYYQRAKSVAPDLIQDVARVDSRFITDFCRRLKLQEGTFYKGLGTLGGGNHFIEYGEEDDGTPWLSIHCGSRNLGVKVASHWHNIAANPKRGLYMGFLWGDAMCGYFSDMVVAQAYSLYNHRIIRDRIMAIVKKLCKARCEESVFSMHNYISLDGGTPVLRKGAISAGKGERVAIPLNMADGIALGFGKGNADWLNTAPHGAGRRLSRAQARKILDESEFRHAMDGVFSTSICAGTLDESPMAYKPSVEILELIEPTVEVTGIIRPKLNIKDVSGKI